jgi:hypothetical protein
MQSHYRLDTSYELTTKGQYTEAIDLLENLLADVEPQQETFALQRFYASFLLTQAQILQTGKERSDLPATKFQAHRISPRALMAMFHLGAARDLAEAAAASPGVSPSGQRLIPGRLEAMSIDTILTHLDLLVIAFYGGLRFQDKMRISIDRLKTAGDVTKLESCEEVFDQTRVLERIRPWIALALSRYLRLSDPQEAFRFAVRALRQGGLKSDPLSSEELVHWIKSGSTLEFKCTNCDRTVVADRDTCYNCGESYLKAYGVKRANDTTK